MSTAKNVIVVKNKNQKGAYAFDVFSTIRTFTNFYPEYKMENVQYAIRTYGVFRPKGSGIKVYRLPYNPLP